MSKNISVGNLEDIENENWTFVSELVGSDDISFLEGRLKTFIDSIIPESQVVQNKATKDIIRVILWDWFNFIAGHYTDHLKDKREWYKEHKGLDGKELPENN